MRIGQEEHRRARTYLIGSSAAISLSAAGIIFSFQYLIQSFFQSNFYTYLSLLFSDPDVALIYWREFTLSLIETTPLFEITLSLIAVVTLLISIRVFVNNMRGVFVPSFTH